MAAWVEKWRTSRSLSDCRVATLFETASFLVLSEELVKLEYITHFVPKFNQKR